MKWTVRILALKPFNSAQHTIAELVLDKFLTIFVHKNPK